MTPTGQVKGQFEVQWTQKWKSHLLRIQSCQSFFSLLSIEHEGRAMISERSVVHRTKRMGPSTEPWGTPYMSCDGDEDELLTEVDWYLSERYEWNHWSAVDWMPKTEFRRERRIWWSVVSKAAERSNKRTEMLSLSRAERILFTICNKTVSVLYPAR